ERGIRATAVPDAAADASSPGLEIRPVEHHGPQRPATERSDRQSSADADSAPWGRHEPRRGPSPVQGPAVNERPPVEPGRRDSSSGSGQPVDWRQFGPAITRWEHITGRPAPRPTEPGRTGERLAPVFVEWLMGLPVGWV